MIEKIKSIEQLSLGGRIKNARKKENLTQKELGELINRSEITIRKYESGDVVPSLDMIKKIAEALKIGANQLMGIHRIGMKIDETFKEAFFQFVRDKRYLLNAKNFDPTEYEEEEEKLYKEVIYFLEFYSYKLEKEQSASE